MRSKHVGSDVAKKVIATPLKLSFLGWDIGISALCPGPKSLSLNAIARSKKCKSRSPAKIQNTVSVAEEYYWKKKTVSLSHPPNES